MLPPGLPAQLELGQREQIMLRHSYVIVLCVGTVGRICWAGKWPGKVQVVTADPSKNSPEDDAQCGGSPAHKADEKMPSVCVRVIADHVICHRHTTHDLPDTKNLYSPSRSNTSTLTYI